MEKVRRAHPDMSADECASKVFDALELMRGPEEGGGDSPAPGSPSGVTKSLPRAREARATTRSRPALH
eukprot:6526997-Prymnesium_polylepis.1